MKLFADALGIRGGDAVCFIGCGGKTSTLYNVAHELADLRVLVTTTAHIQPPGDGQILPHMELLAVPSDNPGKLKGVNPERLERERRRFDVTLIEGDGSALRPLKGWAEHEPAVPDWVTLTVGVVALWPVGLPVSGDTAFRMERFCALTGARPGEAVTLPHIYRMITAPSGMFAKAKGRRALFINQVESDDAERNARELAEELAGNGMVVAAGSARDNRIIFSRQV